MKSLFQNERIYFVYSDSDSLNDEFAYGLEIVNFDEALFRHLKNLGYKRILFYNGVDGLYAFEKGMLRRKKKKKLSGILKREEKEELKLQEPMFESEMIAFLENFMKREKKGAFIITDFFSLLNNLNNEELKQLNQLILDFKQLDVENDSILIFLEPSGLNLNAIKEKLNNYRNLENFIHDIIESSDNLVEIEKAYEDEVNNLLNHMRIKYNLKTDFLNLESISKDIVRFIRQNSDVNLRDIHKSLRDIKKIDFKSVNNKLNLKPEKTGWDKFDELVGVEEVKKKIEDIVKWVKEEKKEENEFDGDIKRFNKIEEKKFKAHLNIVLKGNPGVGKTTIAKIIGDIFKEEGILPYGHFIKASVNDFVAGYVGQTPIKTAELMKKARGGVLFLDEAYGLIPDKIEGGSDFKTDAITTIIDKLDEYKGEICMILAGYEDEINKLFETNEGWNRRFPNKQQIFLRDYTPSELKEIFLNLVKKENVKLDKELENVLDEFFTRAYKSGFTKKYNAGFCENLFNSLMQSKKRDMLTIDGIPEEFKKFLPTKYQNIKIDESIFSEINSLIGLNNVKNELKKIIANIYVAKLRGDIVTIPHYAFIGNPGTGKTTVAKLLGKIFKEMGLLKGKFIMVSESDLIDSRVGETPKKVKKMVEKAKNGILFIDEAYSLMNTQAGQQAIDTLIQEMENKRGEFCLILAGYKNEMKDLISQNPGFKDRIDKEMEFEDYNEEELFKIFMSFVKNNGFEITFEAKERVKELISEMVENKTKHFGNARAMRKLFERIKENVNLRIYDKLNSGKNVDEEIKLIKEEDIK